MPLTHTQIVELLQKKHLMPLEENEAVYLQDRLFKYTTKIRDLKESLRLANIERDQYMFYCSRRGMTLVQIGAFCSLSAPRVSAIVQRIEQEELLASRVVGLGSETT